MTDAISCASTHPVRSEIVGSDPEFTGGCKAGQIVSTVRSAARKLARY